jgi:AcrR family transcriptional regulator
MTKGERRKQLLALAWEFIAREGTDALTLAKLAECAGVTKPIAYEHFGTRAGLLAALYREYDDRQTAVMRRALADGKTFADTARILAEAYVDCVVTAGPEVAAVSAALAGAPEMEAVKRECQEAFVEECRAAFAPHIPGDIEFARLVAVIGAADGLSLAAATGRVDPAEAKALLASIIASILQPGKT